METNLLLALKQFQHNVEVNPDCLRNLIGEKLLEEQFSMVADTLLFGGFLLINRRFEIYAHSIEFYFHVEKSANQEFVHDPVMFHRNKLDDADYRTVNTPYLKIGSFYLHKFGLDITFEKEGEYRASILIKTFNVVDRNEQSNKANLNRDKRMASSYIYDYLQFMEPDNDTLKSAIQMEWLPELQILPSVCSVTVPRININKFVIDNNGNQTSIKSPEKDTRPWRYYRKEPYHLLTNLLKARRV